MGIINPVFGPVRNSIGNLKMYERDGKNIASHKPLPTNKKPTPKQKVQRTKMKVLSGLFKSYFYVLNDYSIKASKIRNNFLAYNQQFIDVNEETFEYTVAYDKLQIAEGLLDPPKVAIKWDNENRNVEIEVLWQALSPIAQENDDLFVMFSDYNDPFSEGHYLGKRRELKNLSFKLEGKKEFTGDHFHVYFFAISANRKHLSKTAYVYLEKK